MINLTRRRLSLKFLEVYFSDQEMRDIWAPWISPLHQWSTV